MPPVSSHLCRHTLQGSAELSQRGDFMSFKIELQQMLFLLLQFFSIQVLNGEPVFPIF